MVGCLSFFFGNRNHIHKLYQEFFEIEPEDDGDNNKGVEDTTEVDEKGSTARFYFTLTYRLAKEDITKLQQVEETNLYLCLNTASLMKEEVLKQKEEMRKMKNHNQMK